MGSEGVSTAVRYGGVEVRAPVSVPTDGGVHNVYVTPDGRHMVAGMIGARSLSAFDTETDEHVWSLAFDQGDVTP
ncbi:MAG TPA: hypothetical protein EYQ27_12300 [Gemmatimonadetes bacterium]|nr:hypothetical protein [Gemmatimonadota bacterium]